MKFQKNKFSIFCLIISLSLLIYCFSKSEIQWGGKEGIIT